MTDDIVARLRDWASCSLDRGRVDASKDFTEAADTIETLRAERDEARREVCAFSYDGPRRTAEDRGWDCFKEPADAP